MEAGILCENAGAVDRRPSECVDAKEKSVFSKDQATRELDDHLAQVRPPAPMI
jgi:hypothetical protein